ncbi:MAG: hypothetical protein WCO37_01135 [Bacteroidota bacterium]|jgi:hypothetical protein
MKNKTLLPSLILGIFLVANALQAQEKKEPTTQTEQTFVAGKYTVKYFLDGRKVTKVPKIDILTADKGSVVIEFQIDKYGNVTSAAAVNETGCTTNTYLLTKAKQAAETTHFDTAPTSPLKQKGKMVFEF